MNSIKFIMITSLLVFFMTIVEAGWSSKERERSYSSAIKKSISTSCDRKIRKYTKIANSNPNNKYYRWRLNRWKKYCKNKIKAK